MGPQSNMTCVLTRRQPWEYRDKQRDLFVITKPEIWSYAAANQEMSNITRKSPEARKR